MSKIIRFKGSHLLRLFFWHKSLLTSLFSFNKIDHGQKAKGRMV